MLRTTGTSLLGLVLADRIMTDELTALAQSSEGGLEPLNRFPRMMQNYLVRRVREVEALANEKRTALKTKADAEKYVQSVRERIRTCFGPEPKRTPLKPQITGVVERDALQDREGDLRESAGNAGHGQPLPPQGPRVPRCPVWSARAAIRRTARPGYQEFAQGLVLQGYIVLIYDPIGQGERLQYVKEDLKSRIGVGVREHLYAGNQQMLVGEFFGSWRAWDGVRALDYLLTRPEVDKSHIGVTGNSGRRNDDHLAVRRRTAMDHGGAFVLCDHLPSQLRE